MKHRWFRTGTARRSVYLACLVSLTTTNAAAQLGNIQLQTELARRIDTIKRRDIKYRPETYDAVDQIVASYQRIEQYPQIKEAVNKILMAIGDTHGFYVDPAEAKTVARASRNSFGVLMRDGYVLGFTDDALQNSRALLPGDRLLSIDGVRLDQKQKIGELLGRAPNTVFVLAFSRRGKTFELRRPYTEHRTFSALEGRALSGGTVYLSVPTEDVPAAEQPTYAQATVSKLNTLTTGQTCGIVLDLRLNGGGVAGLGMNLAGRLFGPGRLLSSGPAGSPDQVFWSYHPARGVTLEAPSGKVLASTAYPGAALTARQPWIALLVGPYTASAAEMIALASRVSPRTILIGEKTRGDTTDLSTRTFEDGSELRFSAAYFYDLQGKAYGDGITPDIAARTDWNEYGTAQDAPIKAARKWLAGKGCA